MFKNYLKIAVRNLLKHKTYSFINILGLTIGITSCLLILLYVQDELSYDRFHEQADRISRVLLENEAGEFSTLNMFSVASKLKEEYPEIRKAVRLFRHWESPLIVRGQKKFIEEQFFFADSSFFDIFSFPLRHGDPRTALDAPFSVVLTESAARKYFGDEEPLGKTLLYKAKYKLEVKGVMQDAPHASHFRPDFVASMPTLPKVSYSRIQEEWSVFYTYVVLQHDVAAAQVERKAVDFYRRQYGPKNIAQLQLQPITDIHLHSHTANEFEENSDVRYLYLLSAIGLLIFLIACINYINLTTARAMNRAQEVGMRKMVGAHRFQIIRQFFGESLLLSFLALLLSIGLAEVLLPTLNQLTGKHLAFELSSSAIFLESMGVVLLVGLLAGLYPAVFLSRCQPAGMLKGQFKSSSHSRFLRKGLVVVQFATSLVLIVGTLVIYKQLEFIRTANLGFNKEQVVVIPVRDRGVRRQYTALRDEWLRNADVMAVGVSSSSYPGKSHSFGFIIKREGASNDDAVVMHRNWVDSGFLGVLGIEVAVGRGFSDRHETDREAVLLNETAVNRLGWTHPKEALGGTITLQTNRNVMRLSVIGVVKDYHFQSLHHQIEPLIFTPVFHTPTYLLVRVRSADLPRTLAELKANWEDFAMNQPFAYSFLDETVDALYRADVQWGQAIGYASFIAILIACLGLFGLAAFSAEQRTKEIGIRKVLGATVTNVVSLLSQDFIKLVLLANLIAWPMAWFSMNQWLQSFAYRINIDWWVFALAGGLALFIALLTVSTLAIRAALANPVKSLRYE